VNEELRRQIETLHAELTKVSSVEPQSRALLIALLTDITRLLEQSNALAVEQQSLTGRLDELAVQFEAEHPALGTALRQVVDTLGKAGI
jgi:hypothetical protein